MDMIERVARKICADGGFDPDEAMPNGGPRWKYYEPGARAAIEAMREPTHEMLLAGDKYLYDARWPDALPQHIQRGLFDAMISGALPPTSN